MLSPVRQIVSGSDADSRAQLRASWAPDGSRLAYSASTSLYYYEVVAVDRSGLKADTLTRSGYFDILPAWSPDGTRIAFVSYGRTSGYGVYVMDADGSNQAPVIPDTMGNIESLAWSPDGSRLIFTGYSQNASGVPRLWGVDASGFSGFGMIHSQPTSVYAQGSAWSPASTTG